MPTGDSLSLFLALLSLAGTAAVAAYTVSGAKARNLWLATGILAVVALASLLNLPVALGTSAAAVLGYVWLGYPLFTVTIVAIMLGTSRPASANQPRPAADHGALLKEVDDAIDRADWQNLDPPQPSIDEGIAILESAFASLRKTHGLSTPSLPGMTQDSLAGGVAYLRRIRPFLKAGHIEEAKAAALSFQK